MLYRFIEGHRDEIQVSARSKARRGRGASEDELASATALFIEQVVDELRAQAGDARASPSRPLIESAHDRGVALHDCRRSPSDMVFDYGAVCEAITEAAIEYDATVAPQEFRTLNTLVDRAVAAALDGYLDKRGQADAATQRERLQQLGAFAHEVRNALNAGFFAFQAIAQGPMSIQSRTGDVLRRALERIRTLVEQSLVEVRLDAGLRPNKEPIAVAALFDELTAIVSPDAARRGLPVEFAAPPGASVHGDRHMLVSALSNLVQNALKYTRPGTGVWVRAEESAQLVTIAVEDRCGGLPGGDAEALFAPFSQAHADRSGIGMGLAIVHRVAVAHAGRIGVRDLPGTGCIFSLELPRPG